MTFVNSAVRKSISPANYSSMVMLQSYLEDTILKMAVHFVSLTHKVFNKKMFIKNIT